MDTKEKRQYDSYLKNVRVSKDMLETAIEKGKFEGEVEGKIEGKIEGGSETTTAVVLNGHANGLTVSLLAKITGISESEVIRILKENGREV